MLRADTSRHWLAGRPELRTAALIVLVSILVLVGATPAAAHVPSLEPPPRDAPVIIDDPEVSRAIYGYLAPGEHYDEYRFRVRNPVTRSVGVIVPSYPEHADFRPTLVIAAEDDGAIRIPDRVDKQRQREFEPFSLTYFWVGGEREISFEPDHQYTLRVQPGGGAQSGRYVVVFGGPERFEATDIAATFRELPAIWFGAYGSAPMRWNWLALIPLGLTVGVFLAAVAGVRRLLSKRRVTG